MLPPSSTTRWPRTSGRTAGTPRTPDLGGTDTTERLGTAVAEALG